MNHDVTAYERTHAKLLVNIVEAFRIFWKLFTNVFAPDEDRLQVGPGALHFEPDADDLVGVGEFLLPFGHFFEEEGNELRRQHVLQLNLSTRAITAECSTAW